MYGGTLKRNSLTGWRRIARHEFSAPRSEISYEKNATCRSCLLCSIMRFSPPPLFGIVNLDDSSGIARDYTARGHTFSYDGVCTDYTVVADGQLPRIAEDRCSAAQPTVLFNSDF